MSMSDRNCPSERESAIVRCEICAVVSVIFIALMLLVVLFFSGTLATILALFCGMGLMVYGYVLYAEMKSLTK